MIRLTITSSSPHKTYTFESSYVTIGSANADLMIPEPNLHPIHLQIVEEEGQFCLLNVANDPFVTLNSLPLGKKNLNNHDVIQIGKTSIQFYGETVAPRVASNEESINLDLLLKEIDQMEKQNSKNESVENEKKLPKEAPSHLAEEGEDEINVSLYKEIEKETSLIFGKKIWRLLTPIAMALLLIAAVAGSIAYMRISDLNNQEQITAAEGVSDVAMALTYAQVNSITPQKQNWFDPEFLKNNLASVLSAEYPSFANIDNQGQFRNCPYILRIYTSSDLKQFIVIAQPEATLFHWLFPKPAIAIDSKTMELRMVSNIRGLNRLLANPNVLDSNNAAEISYLIRQGDQIALASFASDKGFIPPKALTLVRPGAENLIYNAPRYYHFSESLLKKAVSLLQVVGNSHEVTRLQQQMLELSKFPNLVLYSSQGMHKAIQAQKALATLVPSHPFLAAYLNLDGLGLISSCHLLLNEDYPDFLTPSVTAEAASPIEQPATEIAAINPITALAHDTESEVDAHHPLFLQLSALANERQRALKAISEKITTLLTNHIEGRVFGFSDNLSKLVKTYHHLDQQQQKKIMQEMTNLYSEYSDMPLSEFVIYIKASGLGIIARESLQMWSKEGGRSKLSPSQIESQLQKVRDSTNLDELNQATVEISKMLNLVELPDTDALIKYQNELHLVTSQQLKKFLLAPDSRLPIDTFKEENRILMVNILKNAWITDSDEYDFYMNEFDLLVRDNLKLYNDIAIPN